MCLINLMQWLRFSVMGDILYNKIVDFGEFECLFWIHLSLQNNHLPLTSPSGKPASFFGDSLKSKAGNSFFCCYFFSPGRLVPAYHCATPQPTLPEWYTGSLKSLSCLFFCKNSYLPNAISTDWTACQISGPNQKSRFLLCLTILIAFL